MEDRLLVTSLTKWTDDDVRRRLEGALKEEGAVVDRTTRLGLLVVWRSLSILVECVVEDEALRPTSELASRSLKRQRFPLLIARYYPNSDVLWFEWEGASGCGRGVQRFGAGVVQRGFLIETLVTSREMWQAWMCTADSKEEEYEV